VDHFLEMHDADLPVPANGVTWTPTLVASLLVRCPRVVVVGTRRNAYVVNRSGRGIATFPEFVVRILEKHFDGAATLDELGGFLRGGGVIHKEVTQAMLRGTSNLVVGRHEVRVQGVQ
jgi:hypothetical protein